MHANAKKQCKLARLNKTTIIYTEILYTYNFKNSNAENAFGHPVDSQWGGVQDVQSRLPGFHAFRVLNSMCRRMSFSPVWVSVPASTLGCVHWLSGKVWWPAQPPSPSPKRCFPGKRGPVCPGMTLPRAYLFCFVFALQWFLNLIDCFFWLFLP